MGPEMRQRLRALVGPRPDLSPEMQERFRAGAAELDALDGADLDAALSEVGAVTFRTIEASGKYEPYPRLLAEYFEGRPSATIPDEATAYEGMDTLLVLMGLSQETAERNRDAFGGGTEGKA